MEEIGRRKGKILREMRRLTVEGGRWKELAEAPPNAVKRKKKKRKYVQMFLT
jgi:IS30 family transposase